MSRRSFVSAAGAMGAAAMASTATADIACANEAAQATEKDPSEAQDRPYHVFYTDILVIGAGFASMSAIDEAIRQKRNVLMIDKGPYGFGGTIGMNWDVCYTYMDAGYENLDVIFTSRTANKKLFKRSTLEDPNHNAMLSFANWGETVTARNEDGTPLFMMDVPEQKLYERGFPRHWQDQLGASDLVTIHDRTMITDVFISNGECVGAMGIYLPTGEFRVYRANATILAAGGSCWMYGWHTICPTSINSPDNTGDVEMAAFRHGARIGDSEHAAYDLMGISPAGYACSDGSIFGGDSMHVNEILDKDGVPFAASDEYDQTRMVTDRPYFNRVVAQTILSGKGSPNGGLYVRADEEMRNSMRQMYLRNVTMLEDKLGIDLSEGQIECALEMYEHGGAPVIDDSLMSTEFPGLFCTRGAGVAGEEGGSHNSLNRKHGSYAMRRAIEYIESHETPADIDWSCVDAEYDRLEELRTRQVENGMRPYEIRREIQEVGSKTLGVIRKTEDLEAGRAELRRIREEDLPRMALSCSTKTYNTEWKEAIENINLLDLTELSVEASLTRPESRGNMYRPDFPETDDENWKCMLAFKRDESGELSYDKVFFEDIEW